MLKIKKIKPMYNAIITTMNKYEEDTFDGSIIDTSKVKGSLKEYQRVIAVGPMVKDIKVGDLVKINPTRYEVKKFKENSLNDGVTQVNPVVRYSFNVVEMFKEDKEEQYLFLHDNDIDFIIEDYEEVPDTPKPNIIMPNTKLVTN